MSRGLREKERKWLNDLKRMLKKQPLTLVVYQSNESSRLMVYDEKTGEEIDFYPDMLGFRECDPVENYKDFDKRWR